MRTLTATLAAAPARTALGPPAFHLGDQAPIRMTGGGRLDYPPGGSQKNPPSSKKFQTFGFNVGDKDGDGTPEGSLQFVDHTPAMRTNGRPFNLRSISWSTFQRTVDGCEDAGVEATGVVELKNTGEQFRFRLWVCDNGEPGTREPHDIFEIQLFFSNGTQRYFAKGVLTGGNIQAHFEKGTTPTTGDIKVTTRTTGSDRDPNGYTVTVEGGGSRPIGINASETFKGLAPGDHRVELSGVAENCMVSGANPRTIRVIAGRVESTTFDVSCKATTGDLKVTTATTGSPVDPDGYTVTVDGTDARPIGTTDSETFTGLTPGGHEVELSGVAENCEVSGENPRSVTVTAGETASTRFDVSCEPTTPTTGDLTVKTATTGSPVDPDGYTVTVDGTDARPIGTTDSETFTGLTPGEHEVELSGVAENCEVSGENPRSVTVTAGETASTQFDVSCAPTAPVVRIAGVGTIGFGSPMPGGNRQEFDFDVASDLTGRLAYRDWGVVRDDGTVATLTVAPTDAETGITGFRDGSARCEDPTRGAEFDGMGRVDPGGGGGVVAFTVAACDNGAAGTGADFFRIDIPSRSYFRGDFLTSGDIVKTTP